MISVVTWDRWGWLGEMAGTTPVVLEHPIHKHVNTKKTESTNKTHDHMAGWLALEMSNNSSVKLNRQETAGSWLGNGWVVAQWLFRKIAGVVLDRCKMAGRWLGGWHQPVPKGSNVIGDRQEMAGRWLGGWP